MGSGTISTGFVNLLKRNFDGGLSGGGGVKPPPSGFSDRDGEIIVPDFSSESRRKTGENSVSNPGKKSAGVPGLIP
jgi:hypothetical protein